jgi:hypothetical protein
MPYHWKMHGKREKKEKEKGKRIRRALVRHPGSPAHLIA